MSIRWGYVIGGAMLAFVALDAWIHAVDYGETQARKEIEERRAKLADGALPILNQQTNPAPPDYAVYKIDRKHPLAMISWHPWEVWVYEPGSRGCPATETSPTLTEQSFLTMGYDPTNGTTSGCVRANLFYDGQNGSWVFEDSLY